MVLSGYFFVKLVSPGASSALWVFFCKVKTPPLILLNLHFVFRLVTEYREKPTQIPTVALHTTCTATDMETQSKRKNTEGALRNERRESRGRLREPYPFEPRFFVVTRWFACFRIASHSYT